MPDLTIELANRLEEINRLVSEIEAFGEQNAVPERVVGHFVVALDELVTNVISYAYTDDAEHVIVVDLRIEDGGIRRISAELIDDGVPYDPLQTPAPDLDLDPADRPVGGLGVHIVRHVMDSVRYQRDGSRNRLTIAKAIG